MSMRRTMVAGLAAVTLVATAGPAFAYGTTPDPNYGTGGVVSYPSDVFEGLVLQVGTSTYLVATTQNGAVIVDRRDQTGALDASYGSGGEFTTPDNTGFVVAATATSDGSVYAVLSPFGPSNRYQVLRVTNAGVADTSFGASGFARTPTNAADSPLAITVDPNGRVYVSGERVPPRGKSYAFILRLTATGGTDRSFAGDGRRDFSKLASSALIGLAAGARTVVAVGVAGPHALATRLRNNGSIDPRFGDHGFVTATSKRGPTAFTSVTLTPTLKVAGLRLQRKTRLESLISGRLPGHLRSVPLCTGCRVSALPIIAPDGSVVTAGLHQHRKTARAFLAAALPNGAADTGISPTGWALVGPVGQSVPLSLAVDGAAVLVTSLSGSATTGTTITRYLPNP
jgi:uncharacterized delta-60 repeat protein